MRTLRPISLPGVALSYTARTALTGTLSQPVRSSRGAGVLGAPAAWAGCASLPERVAMKITSSASAAPPAASTMCSGLGPVEPLCLLPFSRAT
jgi:hypothetical protein